MLMLKVARMLLKFDLNELAMTSDSLIMIPFSFMVVLCDFYFLPRMVSMFDHTFYYFQKNSQEDYDNTSLWQFGLL